MWPFKKTLTEATKSVLWLWRNDPNGWRVDDYQAIHKESGIGIWIGNKDYGLHFRFDITPQDADIPHILRGIREDLPDYDRRTIWREIAPKRSEGVVNAVGGWARRNDKQPEIRRQDKLWLPTVQD